MLFHRWREYDDIVYVCPGKWTKGTLNSIYHSLNIRRWMPTLGERIVFKHKSSVLILEWRPIWQILSLVRDVEFSAFDVCCQSYGHLMELRDLVFRLDAFYLTAGAEDSRHKIDIPATLWLSQPGQYDAQGPQCNITCLKLGLARCAASFICWLDISSDSIGKVKSLFLLVFRFLLDCQYQDECQLISLVT